MEERPGMDWDEVAVVVGGIEGLVVLLSWGVAVGRDWPSGLVVVVGSMIARFARGSCECKYAPNQYLIFNLFSSAYLSSSKSSIVS
jgi:hypothetical protein